MGINGTSILLIRPKDFLKTIALWAVDIVM